MTRNFDLHEYYQGAVENTPKFYELFVAIYIIHNLFSIQYLVLGGRHIFDLLENIRQRDKNEVQHDFANTTTLIRRRYILSITLIETFTNGLY